MENRGSSLLWVLVALVVAVSVISIVLALIFGRGGSYDTYGPFGMMGYGYYGMGIIMPIIGVVTAVFVVVFIFFLLDSSRGPVSNGGSYTHYEPKNGKSPEDIARERFARGEISEEEFRRIKETLRK